MLERFSHTFHMPFTCLSHVARTFPSNSDKRSVVLGNSSFCGTNMSPKCIKISSCICFFIFSFGLLVLAISFLESKSDEYQEYQHDYEKDWSILFQVWESEDQVMCYHELRDMSIYSEETGQLKTPSLEAYIQASTGVEGKELRLSGLAVTSGLTNACQPLVNINKSKFQGNKIALVSLDELLSPICTLHDLAINAQNAGYSVVIYYFRPTQQPRLSDDNGMQTDTKERLLIPVLYANLTEGNCNLNDTDLRSVDISVQFDSIQTGALRTMQWYLARLYYWFLLGPVVTLEWLRRRKKLCFMSGALQQDHEESAIGDERNARSFGEGGLRSEMQEPVANYDQETEHDPTGGEELPLIVVVNDPRTNLTIASTSVSGLFRKIFGKLAIGCGYVILIVAALPVGISSGGLSFFRFDENEKLVTKSFWDSFLKFNVNNLIDDNDGVISATYIGVIILDFFLPLWWSPLQIFCFFLYSSSACKTTWTVPTNSSKLIRSDWFASNLYLFLLGVVVPYCSLSPQVISYVAVTVSLAYFAIFNMVCTVCNLLFIIILNKHEFVTRYVFYISVCMICAYIESAIVAVYYFVMNSEGSLANLKLTALRTVAIGLTLTLSFSSSMHIIRKVTKPRESLFEGLAEK